MKEFEVNVGNYYLTTKESTCRVDEPIRCFYLEYRYRIFNPPCFRHLPFGLT